MQICECGCKKECKNRFVHGHNRRNSHYIMLDETKEKLRQINLGKHHTEKTKNNIRKAMIGTKNALGCVRSDITKEKFLNGGKLRSSWEANIARLFKFLQIEYQYESARFDLGDTIYIPDFHVPILEAYVEVKGNFFGQG